MRLNSNLRTPAKTVLLTGAGFTKNFGGFLGSEMWAIILNQKEVTNNPRLRNALLEDLNYESVYDTILYSGQFENREKLTFLSATIKAYVELHENILKSNSRSISIHAEACREIVGRFKGVGKERGFFFTLNQDLFIERYFSTDNCQITIPGLHHQDWFNGKLGLPLDDKGIVHLPEEARVGQLKQSFWNKGMENYCYVKLHGSFGWWGQSGEAALVIGNTKSHMIEQEPLLRWYFELFEEVLSQPNIKLVIIGYGFRDSHINKVIANAVQLNGLKLFVVSTLQPSEFKDLLHPIPGSLEMQVLGHLCDIWKGLAGYYCASVNDLFVQGRSELTPVGKSLFRRVELIE